ncbi:MAG: hypothetical protein ACOWWM_15205 [Desulfobacterales bacterium]
MDSGLIRPPFGHLNLLSSIDIYREGYRSIGWSHHAEDWLDHSPEVIFAKLSERIKPGSIILLHDNLIHFERVECRDRRPTIAAVDKLLSSMRHFQFVAVDHLLRSGTPVYRRWRPPTDADYIGSLLHSPH